MAELSKTAAAAIKADKKSREKATKALTFPEVLKETRKLLDAHLSVPPLFTRQILDEYEKAIRIAEAAPDAPPVDLTGQVVSDTVILRG